MRNAIRVSSYDSSNGKIELEVNVAPDLYLDLKTVESVYQEKGSISTASVRLDKNREKGKSIREYWTSPAGKKPLEKSE